MINYKDAYVLLHIECEIPFNSSDQGKKFFILKTLLRLLKILKHN